MWCSDIERVRSEHMLLMEMLLMMMMMMVMMARKCGHTLPPQHAHAQGECALTLWVRRRKTSGLTDVKRGAPA